MLQFGPSSNWVTLNISQGATSFNAFGLSASTAYIWEIRTYCDEAQTRTSGWSADVNFVTAGSGARLAADQPSNFFPKKELVVDAFPNPNTGDFKISIFNPFEDEFSLIIRDIMGRSCFEMPVSRELKGENGQMILPISLNSTQAGVYFLEVLRADKRIVQKIVIR